MKSPLSALVLLAVAIPAGTSFADPTDVSPTTIEAERYVITSSDVEPTPEMWLYSQERERYEDPKAAVRRKAEFRAEQRQQRIAAMKAYGMSKQRPLVTYTPFHTYYSVFTTRGWLTTRPVYTVQLPQSQPFWK